MENKIIELYTSTDYTTGIVAYQLKIAQSSVCKVLRKHKIDRPRIRSLKN